MEVYQKALVVGELEVEMSVVEEKDTATRHGDVFGTLARWAVAGGSRGWRELRIDNVIAVA